MKASLFTQGATMHGKWITLSVCVLALAGCQTMRGTRPSAAEPAPAPSASTGTAAAAAQTSPWQAARERGMIFRATGHDPAWSVEVQKSRTPTLFITLPERQRHIQVPASHPFGDPQTGTAGFRGTASDGTPVELLIHRGQCQDDMSGKKLDASAQLNLGAQQYKGCGRFLFRQNPTD